MSAPWWLTPVFLIAAAGIAGWPSHGRRARRRNVIGRRGVDQRAAGKRKGAERVAVIGRRQLIPRWARASPWRATLATAALAGCAGLVAGGVVAALAVAAYGGLAVRSVLRLRDGHQAERERRRQLDGLCALAADLRAGLPAPALVATAHGGGGRVLPANAPAPDRISALTLAAGRLAEQTGAPLADLVERIEADARATDRGLAGAAAQAAGARATAWLLAGLPLGGIALGYGIGVDPLDVLLHTPIGAGCVVGAIALQFTGLAWANRLSGGTTRAA